MSDGNPDVHCDRSPAVVTRYRKDADQTPTEVIADAVGTATGLDPMELPPLYEFVDPSLVERLLDHHRSSTEAVIRFKFDAVNVVVCADGTIQIFQDEGSAHSKSIFETRS